MPQLLLGPTYFPIAILIRWSVAEWEELICYTPRDVPIGHDFKVLATRVREPS